MQFSKIFQLVAAIAAFSAPALAQSAADANAGLATRSNPAHGEPGHVHVLGDELVARGVGGDKEHDKHINRPGRSGRKPRMSNLPRHVAEEAAESEAASTPEGAVDTSEESALEARDPATKKPATKPKTPAAKPKTAQKCKCIARRGTRGIKGLKNALEARRDPGYCYVCKDTKAGCACDAMGDNTD